MFCLKHEISLTADAREFDQGIHQALSIQALDERLARLTAMTRLKWVERCLLGSFERQLMRGQRRCVRCSLSGGGGDRAQHRFNHEILPVRHCLGGFKILAKKGGKCESI